MRAFLRHGLTSTELAHRFGGVAAGGATKQTANGAAKRGSHKQGKPMSIFYGSNTGTCEAFAQRLAADATAHGYSATVVDALDAANENLPNDRPVVIITASYEGEPPDNAALFYKWIASLKGDELQGVSYAVFGCGHHDWTRTFHRVPKLVDSTIEARGGSRLCGIGLTDAAEGQMLSDFEQWEDAVFWPAIEAKYGVAVGAESEPAFSSTLSVQFSAPRVSTLRQDVKEAVVVESVVLTAPGAVEKKHTEIQLPDDMTYKPGDYLAVLPMNPKDTISRVTRRFRLSGDAHITIAADGRTTFPTDVPIPVVDVLGAYVELAQPATKRVRSSLLTVKFMLTDISGHYRFE